MIAWSFVLAFFTKRSTNSLHLSSYDVSDYLGKSLGILGKQVSHFSFFADKLLSHFSDL